MKIKFRRAVAIAAVCATTAAGAMSLAPVANAHQPAAARAATPVKTPFGYNTVASGVKVMAQGVDVRTVRAALVSQSCTRLANGDEKVAKTALATPDNPLINVSAITSTSKTYKVGTRYGAISTNQVGDISIGSADTGTIVIKGLVTSADAFHTPTGYHAKPSLDLTSIAITLPGGTEIPAPLQDLLNAIDTQVIANVIDVLQTATAPIDIPGFGKIAIGETWTTKDAVHSSADAHGLVIQFTGDGNNTVIYLGQAHARIGGPAPSAVFRSNLQAMDLSLIDNLVHLSRVGAVNIPCEGSRGNTLHKVVASAGLVSPLVVNLTGIDNSYSGQQTKDGVISGWVKSHTDMVEIPLAQLVIKNINTKITVNKKPGSKVTSSVATAVGSIEVGGETIPVPKPGEVASILNGAGTIEFRILKKGKLGAQAKALKVTIFDPGVVIYLGWADNNIWFN